jgi:hypothetical protein
MSRFKYKIKKYLGGISGNFLTILIILFIFSSLALPFILMFVHPNMQMVIGTPKAVYFYDIDQSCNKNQIETTLEHLSSDTGIKFIQLPQPFGLILGGIGYTCGGYLSNYGAIGESESGFVGASYFIISWNKIRLVDTSEDVVLHETLHSMGFAHSQNPNNIMYPIRGGNSQLDSQTIDFLKMWYTYNPLAYLNIFSFNIISMGIFIIMIIGLVSLIQKKIPKKFKRR